MTTRKGDFPGHSRVVSDGLSRLAVRRPTRMASLKARRRCTLMLVSSVEKRTAGPSVRSALFLSIYPSALCAHFSMMYGRLLPW